MTSEGRPATRLEIGIALALAAALLFALVIVTAAVHFVPRTDFTGYYISGVLLREGKAARLYDPGTQAQIERQLFHRQDLLLNPHPAFEALGFALLARLSAVKAYVLWGAINVLLWLLFQHLLRRHLPKPGNVYRYILLCALFSPLWLTLIQGQTSVLLLVVFSLTFVCLLQNYAFRAGVCLGLGLFKFPAVLPFALICALRKKWRLMAGFVAAASLLGLLSLGTVGLAGMRAYTHLLLDILRNPGNPAYANLRHWRAMPTLEGFFTSLLAGRVPADAISTLVAVASAALVLLVAWRWRREDQAAPGAPPYLMFAAALTVSLVAAPHLYTHDLTLMLLAVLLVINSPAWAKNSTPRKILVAAMVILYAPPVFLLLAERQALYLLAPVLVAFALTAASLAARFSADRAREFEQP